MKISRFTIAVIALMVSPASGLAQKAAEHFTVCVSTSDVAYCQQTQRKLSDEWPRAYAGDYAARRNVAYCLSYGCDGAVVISRTLGCAWRMVIARSGSPEITAGDTSNLNLECGRLTPQERAIAERQAVEIERRNRS
jgi:hypothetical protein